MSDNIKNVLPVYGENYKAGYVGFTYTTDSFISKGIAWFTRWDRMSDIKVSHVFLVSGNNECIEAQPKGVVVSDIGKYFDDEHCLVFFREPRVFNDQLAIRTIGAMRAQVGQKYGYSMIVADAIAGSFLGRLLGVGKLFQKWCDGKKSAICSESVATAMKKQPEYDGIGILRLPANRITPQNLFEDDGTFKPWKNATATPSVV